MRSRRGLAGLAVVAIFSVVLAGCGGEELPRPITDDEADALSEVFFANYEEGGADFTLNAALPDGSAVTMIGEVDFENGAGMADVTATGSLSGVTEVAWGGDVIFERQPALSEQSEIAGLGPIDFVAHTADPEQHTLDALVAVVAALASQSRENPLLLQQNGVVLERRDTLGSTPVEVYRYGDRTRIWVKERTSTLVRFEGNNADGTRPVIVDLAEPGPRELALPPGAVVLDEGELEAHFAQAS
jgi:hypothetical protein